jgi:hypothetical protein
VLGRGTALQERVDQHRDVGHPLAQRRQVDREGADAVVQVLAEAAVGHHRLQRLVGGRHQAEIGLLRFDRAHARKVPDSISRSSLTCIDSGTSPISSRNSVPPLAVSTRPGLRAVAPVKAPFS